MTAEALLCRGIGTHALVPVPIPVEERREFARLGQRKRLFRCVRKCGYWRYRLTNLKNGELIGTKSGYDDPRGYRLPPGSGRLPRAAAEVAYYAYGGDD